MKVKEFFKKLKLDLKDLDVVYTKVNNVYYIYVSIKKIRTLKILTKYQINNLTKFKYKLLLQEIQISLYMNI